MLDFLGIPRATLAGHRTRGDLAGVCPGAPGAGRPAGPGQRFARSVETSLSRELLLFLIPVLGVWQYSRLRKDPQQPTARSSVHHGSRISKRAGLPLPPGEPTRVEHGQRRGFLSRCAGGSWLPASRKRSGPLGESAIPPVIWGAEDRINPVGNARPGAMMPLPAGRRLRGGHNLHQSSGSRDRGYSGGVSSPGRTIQAELPQAACFLLVIRVVARANLFAVPRELAPTVRSGICRGQPGKIGSLLHERAKAAGEKFLVEPALLGAVRRLPIASARTRATRIRGDAGAS